MAILSRMHGEHFHRSPSGLVAVPPIRGRLGLLGMTMALFGAWSGIVPFVAPGLGFGADDTASWYWNLSHALLWLVPGAAAVFVGLTTLGVVGFRRLHRLPRSAGYFLVTLCGAWLVLGQWIWPILEGSRVFFLASPLTVFTREIAYSLGPGVLLIALGGMALGMTLQPVPAEPAVQVGESERQPGIAA